ncbi:MAG: antibiotic biosynthesis monooxygenase [Candidatus Bathyarchaeia archaeon]|jgi:heme-degrading monooxygenase HmoA
MYARAVNVQFQSGKIQEASRIVKDSIVPVMQKQKGFKGQLLLTQRDTGKAISINLWETQDDLTQFETSPLYRELMDNLAGVLAGPPTGERYEVSVFLDGIHIL